MRFNLFPTFYRLSVLTLLVFLLSGCVSTKGKPIPKDSVVKIQKGITTKTDILEQFGAPDEILYSPRGEEIFIYRYSEKLDLHAGQAVGVILRRDVPGLGTLVDLGTRRVSEKEDRLMVFLDDKGIVQNIGFTHETGKGK
ncbi:MAG TPA: hypothetical protein VNM22_22405 [Candidatus Limnocylindrales bacterium]|nr:hypothetical protein [Candidatus Limnocylindrales bacterium]